MDWDISSKFGMQIDIYILKRIQPLKLNSEVDFWLHRRHLEKSIWRHNPAMDGLITTKFGRLKQNYMPRTTHRSKPKSEVKLRYGSRPFSETGSSFISAVDWDVSLKFDTQIDFRLLKRMESLKLNSEVAAILKNRYDVITLPSII